VSLPVLKNLAEPAEKPRYVTAQQLEASTY
jgi:hypothetical protein